MLNNGVELLCITAAAMKQKKHLLGVFRENMKSYLEEIIQYDKPYDENESLDLLISMNMSEVSDKYLVYANGCCCGFVVVVPTLLVGSKEMSYIRHLYIKKEYRGMGYGEQVAEQIRAHYPLPWVLEILKHNEGARFFWQHYCSKKDLRLKKKVVKLKSKQDTDYYSCWCDIMEILPNTEK